MNHHHHQTIPPAETRLRSFTNIVRAATLLLAILTLSLGIGRAQYITYCGAGDTIWPRYTAVLENQSGTRLSGLYYVKVYLDGQFFDQLHFNVTDEASIVNFYQITDLGGTTKFLTATNPCKRILTTDGHLYLSDLKTIAGSVSTELAEFSFVDPHCPGCQSCQPRGYYYPFITLRVSPQECPECTATCLPGGVTADTRSLEMEFGLGKGTNFQGTSKLVLKIDEPMPDLATPRYLVAAIDPYAYWVAKDSKGVHQVLSGQMLASVITNNNFRYTVQFHKASEAGAFTNGLYAPTNSPYKTITVENPDASPTIYNRLWITTTEGNFTNRYEYTYVNGSSRFSNTWQLVYPSNLRKQILTTTWNTNLTERTTLLSVYTPGTPDVLAYQERKRFKNLGWGPVLVEQVLDPAGLRLTNSWDYYTNLIANTPHTRLKQMIRWDGFWERYEYDQLRRETNRISGFLNSTNGSPPNACRVTRTSYTNFAPNVTRIEYSLGQEIARTYQVYSGSTVSNIQCQTAGASWTNPANIITVTKSDLWARPTNAWHIDGTRTIYSYVTNADKSVTTTVTTGRPTAAGTSIDDGTRTIIVVGPFGQMISNIVLNVTGGTTGALLDRDSYSYAPDDYAFRAPVVTHLDGTQTSGGIGCCGSPNLGSRVDKDGTTTTFAFDALERLTSSTVNGVTTSNTFDAFGNLLATLRRGADNSTITNRLAAYDRAARLISETTALNGTTSHTNYFDTLGQFVHKATFADGGIRIETYFLDGQLQSITGSATFPVRYEYGVEQDNGVYRAYTKEIRLDSSGNDTSEWTKTYIDMLGRSYKKIYASAVGTPFSLASFNNKGQLTNQVDPDGVTTLHAYNGKGEQTHTVLDFNQNSAIEFGGIDRVVYATNDVVNDNGTTVRRTRTFVWSTNNVTSSNLISTIEISDDGLRSWELVWNNGVAITNRSQTVYIPVIGLRILTNIATDGSYVVLTNQFGRLTSATRYDALHHQLGAVTYGYDAHGRRNTVNDSRNGTTILHFNNNDQLSGLVAPAPNGGQAAPVTTNYFDSMGRIWKTTLSDDTSVTNEFYPNGLLHRTYGSRTYPVEYTYDHAGRMKTMKTWQKFSENSGEAVTSWSYDVYRGFLTNKTYDGGIPGPTYTYTAAGRLQTRTWARGVTTSYGYSAAGELATVAYSDGTTPNLTNVYDRRGRPIQQSMPGSQHDFTYNNANELLSEVYSGGPLDGLTVTNIYDPLLRRATNGLWNGSAWLAQTRYTYDDASRLQSVGDGTNSAIYSYLANSPLVGQISFVNNGAPRMTTTKSYDLLNRLTTISSAPSASPAINFQYGYNSGNQRTGVTNTDDSRWVYQYDELGQVISGKKYWSDGTVVAGQQFEYSFDDIGNRVSTRSGGDADGTRLRSSSYSINSLNQYTNRVVPHGIDVIGTANSNATVTVNGELAYRRGEYFHEEVLLRGSAAAFVSATNLAVLNDGTNADIITTNIGSVLLPPLRQQFRYDPDGNLTNDGLWQLTWNAENQLISVESAASAPAASRCKLDFTYDPSWRRTQKIVSKWNGAAYIPQSTNRFVYDGWNLLAILDGTNGLDRSFTWGTDLSGTKQGAGGIGGLISMTVHRGTNAGTYFYSYDGNGNVVALTRAADSTPVAQYEYGTFGELIRTTGPLAPLNPFLYSTKYRDDEIGCYYFGFRYYDPATGRWLSTDPLGTAASVNIYAYLGNDCLNLIDLLGLSDVFNIFNQRDPDDPASGEGLGFATGLSSSLFERPSSQKSLMGPAEPHTSHTSFTFDGMSLDELKENAEFNLQTIFDENHGLKYPLIAVAAAGMYASGQKMERDIPLVHCEPLKDLKLNVKAKVTIEPGKYAKSSLNAGINLTTPDPRLEFALHSSVSADTLGRYSAKVSAGLDYKPSPNVALEIGAIYNGNSNNGQAAATLKIGF